MFDIFHHNKRTKKTFFKKLPMNCLCDISRKGSVMQCFRMGHFIAYTLRAHFSPQYFFREILTCVLNIILAFVVYLIFPTGCGRFLVVKCRHSLQYYTEVMPSLYQLRALYWCPENDPDGQAAAAGPCFVEEQWPPQQKMTVWQCSLYHHCGPSAKQSFIPPVEAGSQCMNQATIFSFIFSKYFSPQLWGTPIVPFPPFPTNLPAILYDYKGEKGYTSFG